MEFGLFFLYKDVCTSVPISTSISNLRVVVTYLQPYSDSLEPVNQTKRLYRKYYVEILSP